MIIDAHTHIDDVTITKFSNQKRLKLLLENMKKNKIDHSLVIADLPVHKDEKKIAIDAIIQILTSYKDSISADPQNPTEPNSIPPSS